MTSEWREAPLGELLLRLIDHRGRTPKKLGGVFVETGVRVISAKNIRNGRLDLETNVRFITPEMFDRWMPEKLRAGDVLLTSEAPMGSVAFLDGEHDYCLGQRLFALRAEPSRLDGRFLYYMLLSPLVQGRLRARLSGTTAEGIRQAELVKVLLPYPALQEQRRISQVLGAVDDLIENNRRRIALLEQMAQAIYREWFVHFRYPGHEDDELVDSPAGPIPPGWSLTQLGELGKVVTESVAPSEIDPTTPSVGLEHIPRCSFTLSEWGRAGDLASRKTRFSVGDVLFGKIRPYFHKVCVAPLDGIASSDAIVVRAPQQARGLVTMTMFSDDFVAHAVTTSNGTKMPRADWKVLREWPVPIPPDRVLSVFEKAVASAVDSCNVLASQSRILAELRDLLLPKLVTGAIDVSKLDLDALLEESAA